MTRQITIVCPTLLDHDAVGAATAALYRNISANKGWQVSVLTRRNDRADTPSTLVSGLGDMLLHPDFLSADLIIYIYAIYSDLFDAMLIGNGHGKQVVRFHNVTPRQFVEESDHDIIDRSFEQLRHFDALDEVWADSLENINELAVRNIAHKKSKLIPLSVNPPVRRSIMEKSSISINILYVGRIVRSKGLVELISALSIFKASSKIPFQATLVGNINQAPEDYVTQLRARIARAGLTSEVRLEGPVSGPELSNAYGEAHLIVSASHHEGFCVPVIEGLAAGCIPVTYANSNLRHISGGLGRLAATDRPEALADAIERTARALVLARKDAAATLPLERGPTEVRDFDRLSRLYVAKFAAGRCAKLTRQRVEALLSASTSGPRPTELTPTSVG